MFVRVGTRLSPLFTYIIYRKLKKRETKEKVKSSELQKCFLGGLCKEMMIDIKTSFVATTILSQEINCIVTTLWCEKTFTAEFSKHVNEGLPEQKNISGQNRLFSRDRF